MFIRDTIHIFEQRYIIILKNIEERNERVGMKNGDVSPQYL